MNMKTLFSVVEEKKSWIHDTLRELVEQESPSENWLAVNSAAALVEHWASQQGARTKRHRRREFGDILELRFGPSRSSHKPVLLLGHLDTVWPIGTLKKMPWREADGRYFGPGVLDMKAGVVMALTALRALHDMRANPPVILLLNSDEEVGSTISRPI